jgi:protein phosphatase
VQLRPTYFGGSDVGRRREVNEDHLHAGVLGVHAGSNWHLLAVADGVGGRRRGDWASHLAISTLVSRLSGRLAQDEAAEALRWAFVATNQALWQGAQTQPDTQGAATTLVAVLLNERRAWWANVGDSRAYLLRQGRLEHLTIDHSWVEEQVRAGGLTPEQARTSGRRNVITRSIGGEPQVEVDVGGPMHLQSGDVVIVCSDGLHGQVSDEEIAAVTTRTDPRTAVERLIRLSNERGGVDNVSVIVCAMRPPET